MKCTCGRWLDIINEKCTCGRLVSTEVARHCEDEADKAYADAHKAAMSESEEH